VVDALVRAELAGPRELLVAAGSDEHARAVPPRNLDGGLAHAAAGANHEHVIAARSRARVISMCHAGEERQRKRRRLDKPNRIGMATRLRTGTFTYSA